MVLNGKESKWRLGTSGVPQGSILGPVLSLIYMNDLRLKHGSEVLKFADDINFFRAIKCLKSLQIDVREVKAWASRN